ncbi:MAG: cytochrome c oxidase subunit 4 [Chloroflexota bacterium]|nr:cytochrome c oxidase subunit 4 [Chloroflexota bacterium]
MPEEMRFLLRAGGYGLGIGAIYYLLSREPAGSVLLVGFGLACVVLLGALWWETRRRGRRLEGPAWRWLLLPPAEAESGFTDEDARLPGSSLAPITLALGVALAALSLVFGVWLLAAAVIPLLFGVRGWLREAMAEHRAIEADTGGEDAAPGGAVRRPS